MRRMGSHSRADSSSRKTPPRPATSSGKAPREDLRDFEDYGVVRTTLTGTNGQTYIGEVYPGPGGPHQLKAPAIRPRSAMGSFTSKKMVPKALSPVTGSRAPSQLKHKPGFATGDVPMLEDPRTFGVEE